MMVQARMVLAAMLIVGAGLIQGSWTNRWGRSSELSALAGRFESVPMVIGDWQATAFEIPAAERAMTGATAFLTRRYTNPSRGTSVSVMLLGGLPAKISMHTPDVCYPGAGYKLDAPSLFRQAYSSDGPQVEFRTALATRSGTNPSVLRIFWGWNASQGWLAPEEPRWIFASESSLCKLYVVRETGGAVSDPENDPALEFLKVFLPELNRLVFSKAQPALDSRNRS